VSFSEAFSQKDTLILSNNDVILGEVKSMDKGILVFETDYSNVDFKIDWVKIRQIFSQTNYLITLSNGKRYNGKLKSLNDTIVEIDTRMPERVLEFSKIDKELERPAGNREEVNFGDIVYLNALEEGFWSRLSFNFDVGTNITRANDLRQFTFNLATGYLADRWKSNLTFNNLRSSQREIDPIKRTELTFAYNYFLQNDWFLLYNLNLLSNTEQLLVLRNSNMLGLGKYLVHTNRVYLGFQGGFNLNNEKFDNQENSTRTAEAFIGAGYNIYDIGDLDLLTNLVVYPSLSTKGRVRSDFKFDIRYEFKFDLFFKIGTTLNYDNQPTEGASSLDYIFQTTLGWKL
jgi:hypothetical protein